MTGQTLRKEALLDSGTPSPNPWDLSLSRQNVCSTLKALERRIGLRRDATRAPIQGPEWQGAGFHRRPQNSTPTPRRALAYCGQKMVLTMGSTLKVKYLTFRAIANHLCDALADAYIYLSLRDQSRMSDIIDGRNRPNPVTPGAIQHLTDQLRVERPRTSEKSEDDIAMEYCEEVRHDFDQIVELLLPRVVQSANSQTLVNALVELDQSWRDVQNAIVVQKRIVAGGVYRDVITLSERAGGVYKALLTEWKPAGAQIP